MAKYKVTAKMTHYCHIIVEANDEVEAMDKAKQIDGGEFICDDDDGGWEILYADYEED